jgi:AcrR family transcriptional regulator
MSKGEETRREILSQALSLASEAGFAGLSIAKLAERVGMSKSGLFAHFSSKDNLAVAVLEEAAERFVERVIAPALKARRGEPRLRELFGLWLAWTELEAMPGGCVFLAASVELDDQPGPARDKLVETQRDLTETLAQAARIAQAEGHLSREIAPEQLAFEMYGIIAAYQRERRLLRNPHARARAEQAFERLLSCSRPAH